MYKNILYLTTVLLNKGYAQYHDNKAHLPIAGEMFLISDFYFYFMRIIYIYIYIYICIEQDFRCREGLEN